MIVFVFRLRLQAADLPSVKKYLNIFYVCLPQCAQFTLVFEKLCRRENMTKKAVVIATFIWIPDLPPRSLSDLWQIISLL